MSKKFVLAFVGMPGSGKSTCVEYLSEKNITSVYFGGVVVDEAKRRYGEANETNEKKVREEMRKQDGMAAIAMRALPKIDELLQEHDIVIADGLYSWSEYKILKDKYGTQLVVIAVAAPRHIRHQRLANRTVRPLTEAEVSAREYAEIENIEKGGPIANADYTVVNDDQPENMHKKLDDILLQIGCKL
jgi:dephospho-CoA kinase